MPQSDASSIDNTKTRRRLVGCEGTPGAGPHMVIVLEVEGQTIRDARFQTYGCPAAAAFGEFVCGWAVNRVLAELDGLTQAEAIATIGAPPLGREHVPGLAVNALKKAKTGETV